MDYHAKKKESRHVAHFVLYELCQQLDAASTLEGENEVWQQEPLESDPELSSGLVQRLGESSGKETRDKGELSNRNQDFHPRD